jgi:hypothetical protein
MGFVNVYASADDIELFGLADLFRRHKPFDKRALSDVRLNVTLDRQRRAVLLQTEIGREEFIDQSTWVMKIGEREFEIRLNRVRSKSTSKLSERPFRIEWALASMRPGFSSDSEKLEVIGLLKEALTVCGFGGAWRQIPETVVTFQF